MQYVVKRLLIGVILIICVSFLVFSMLYMMPGTPVMLMAGEGASLERLEEIEKEYGLDRPLIIQYGDWLYGVLVEQDFGISFKYGVPVWDLVKERIPVSLRLTVITALIQYAIAVPLGLLCAYKKDAFLDKAAMMTSLVMTSIPSFWISVLLMLAFAVERQWFPLSGFSTWKHYVLPITAGVLGGFATTMRLTRSEALDVLRERYVLTAYAKGLGEHAVRYRHVLRNSLIVICVQVFQSLPWLISGYIIIEKMFVIPGMGGLMITSIINQDFNVVQCLIFLISIMTVICNILADLMLGLLDPRIRISIGGGDK